MLTDDASLSMLLRYNVGTAIASTADFSLLGFFTLLDDDGGIRRGEGQLLTALLQVGFDVSKEHFLQDF